ncbi:MAG: ligase-associated DNA damage response endonuclease PdeM [Alphaproteobacteria bacterium]|nr:MAG: ligase-associated DNA damage response endonuclease PdeM [Alphaproteobacteria bacterium]
MAELRMSLAGTEIALDPAGALWLPASRTIVVADLHLEKASALARRRFFLPPYDSGATLSALARLIKRRNPARIICLGDSFHDDGGADRLGDSEKARLGALQAGRDWLWIAGNHDPALPASLPGKRADVIIADGLTLRHEPLAGAGRGEVAGHLHPAAKVRRHGRSVRRRAFVSDGTRLILPAFGVLTGGLNVLDKAFASLFGDQALRAFLLGRNRIYAIARSALRPD